jgi:AraC-like DNA-binding protein
MQSAASVNVAGRQHVFVGALDGHACHPDHQTYLIDPKLVINVYLRGGQRFVIDGKQFVGGAVQDEICRPQVLMVNVKRPAALSFNNADNGSALCKVKMSASQSWLEQEIGSSADRPPALQRFLSTHLSHFAFEAAADLIEVAEQISRPPANLKGDLLTLYRKARAIELVRLACAALVTNAENTDNRLSLITARQVDRARSYILANLTSDLTIGQIAKESGSSISSIQRHFKQRFGTTVFEFIRRKRLEAARDALQARGVTVAEAAWIAGYVSPSSFIAAFKKAYGACPGALRA